jgi:CubicO group peptidase (beta-lactamase class C family)
MLAWRHALSSLLPGAVLVAASAGGAQSPAPTPSPHPLTAADLEPFLDGLIPEQIHQANIAGAVVAVVKDGKLLFAKGYGYADVATHRPISPDRTLVRPGSISKLFTWTAVMQLVEAGKIDLDRDVNTYIDFTIPPAFGKPITMRDLMTHRPGFQETVKDLIADAAADTIPLGTYLKTHLPARIYPPGMTPAYSNYGAALAGYIVQRVSGVPFDAYIEQHIFKPLDMTNATFRQPLPPALKPQMSSGYALATDDAKPFEYVIPTPAGSVSLTAAEITHFMLAHLQHGRYNATQLLQPATIDTMHARQAGWPDSLNAMCLGFYEESRNGHRIIGHGGDTQWFHSDLHLIPDAGVGFFVSYNSAGRPESNTELLRTELFHQFLDRYYPAPVPNAPTLATALADERMVAGTYTSTRGFATNLLSGLTVLLESSVDINPKDSTISVEDIKGVNGEPMHFREVGPLRFRAVGGQDQVAFTTDPVGRHMLDPDFPPIPAYRVTSALDQKGFTTALLSFSLGVLVLTLLGWPIAAMIRKHYGYTLELDPAARRLRRVVRLICMLFVFFVILLLVVASRALGPGLGAHGDLALHGVQLLGLLCCLATVAAIYAAAAAWRHPEQWIWSRIWTTCIAVACVGLAWFAVHWHLFNFNLSY